MTAKAKVRVTFTFEYELDPENYRFDPTTGEDVDASKLTPEDMIKMDMGFLKEGDMSIVEMLDVSNFAAAEPKDFDKFIKFEVL